MDDKELIRGVRKLNKYQIRVLHLTCQGLSPEEAAATLRRDEKTYSYHMGHVYRKLKIPGTTPKEKRDYLIYEVCPKVRKMVSEDMLKTWPPDEQVLMERLGLTDRTSPLETPSTPQPTPLPSQPVILPPNPPDEPLHQTENAVPRKLPASHPSQPVILPPNRPTETPRQSQRATPRREPAPRTGNRQQLAPVITVTFGTILVCATIAVLVSIFANNTVWPFRRVASENPLPTSTTSDPDTPTETSLASLLLTPYVSPTPKGMWFEDKFDNTYSGEWTIAGSEPFTYQGLLKWQQPTWLYYGVGDQKWRNYSLTFGLDPHNAQVWIRAKDLNNYIKFSLDETSVFLGVVENGVYNDLTQEIEPGNRNYNRIVDYQIFITGGVVKFTIGKNDPVSLSLPASTAENLSYGGIGFGLTDEGSLDYVFIRELP